MKLKALRSTLQTIPSRLAVQSTERLRGRAAVTRRSRWLYANPLCVECEKEGRVTAATVPDHITPLWAGGADSEANLQSLCAACHDVKTTQEAAERARSGR